MSINEIRENYYKRIGFSKESSETLFSETFQKKDLLLRANKLIKNPRNPKEHYQSFIRKKNRKSVKQSEIITYQPKTFENQNIVDIQSKLRLSKTIRQAEKVGSNSSLCSDTKKVRIF